MMSTCNVQILYNLARFFLIRSGILVKIGNFEVSGRGIGKYCHRNPKFGMTNGPMSNFNSGLRQLPVSNKNANT